VECKSAVEKQFLGSAKQVENKWHCWGAVVTKAFEAKGNRPAISSSSGPTVIARWKPPSERIPARVM